MRQFDTAHAGLGVQLLWPPPSSVLVTPYFSSPLSAPSPSSIHKRLSQPSALEDSPVHPYPVPQRRTGCRGRRPRDPWQDWLSSLGEYDLRPCQNTPGQRQGGIWKQIYLVREPGCRCSNSPFLPPGLSLLLLLASRVSCFLSVC